MVIYGEKNNNKRKDAQFVWSKVLQAYVLSFLMSQSLAKYRHEKKNKTKSRSSRSCIFWNTLKCNAGRSYNQPKSWQITKKKKKTLNEHRENWENKSLVVLHAYLCFVTSWVRSGLKILHLCEEGIIDINKKLRWNQVNKDSNRIINDNDNNKDYIFIHTAEKKCVFYKSLEQKQKAKKSHILEIQQYRNMHNSKVFCI